MAQANLLLSDVRFSDYILDVTTRQKQPVWNPPWGGNEGLFRVPAIQQQQVIRHEAQNSSVRSAAEASVNFYRFLSASHCGSGSSVWTPMDG
jgi:hypothetical protein